MTQQHTQWAVRRMVGGWLPRYLEVHELQWMIFLCRRFLPVYPSRHIFMNILGMKIGLTRARGPYEITCRHAVKSSAIEISKVAKALRWFGLLGCLWLLNW